MPESPEDLVRLFIRDYYDWNGRAAATIRKPRDAATVERIRQEHHDLLERYCPPGFSGEPPSYGTDSIHDPERTVIVSSEILEGTARVITQKPMPFGLRGVHSHEFDLQRHNGRWFIVGVFYIDGKERLPSL